TRITLAGVSSSPVAWQRIVGRRQFMGPRSELSAMQVNATNMHPDRGPARPCRRWAGLGLHHKVVGQSISVSRQCCGLLSNANEPPAIGPRRKTAREPEPRPSSRPWRQQDASGRAWLLRMRQVLLHEPRAILLLLQLAAAKAQAHDAGAVVANH